MIDRTIENTTWSEYFRVLKKSTNDLKNVFFPKHTVIEMDLTSLVTEMIFYEIFETHEKKDRASLNSILKEVINDLNKQPSGGAYLRYPESIAEGEQEKVILTVEKGDSFQDHCSRINGVVHKFIGYTIDFDNLEADIQCSHNKATIVASDSLFKYLRLGLQKLKWRWGVSPNKQEEIILDINIYRAGNKVNRSVRESAWPDFKPPSVRILVSRSLYVSLKEILNHPWTIRIVGGFLLAYVSYELFITN